MNRRFLFIITVITVIAVSSCNSRKDNSKAAQVQEFRNHLTYNDTLEMLQLCDNAMELLKQQKYDEVIASLYLYDDSKKTISVLSDKVAKSYLRMFEMFPVLEYERVYYSFLLEGCNDVKYSVTFRRSDSDDGNNSPKTAFMFNPVRVDNEWKLCVKTARDKIESTLRR